MDTFTCSRCEEIFNKGWSEEEAQAERRENGWADIPDENMIMLCDDCYEWFVKSMNGGIKK
jgi:rubredoxin